MNSCAASCCTCFRKASCASGTSASWPIAGVPQPCHGVFACSAQHQHHKPSKRFPPLRRAIFGCVPTVARRWWSSRDSPLSRSNFVPHPCRSPLPHDTTIDITKPLRAEARAISMRLAVLQTSSFQLLQPSFRGTLALRATQQHLLLSFVLCRTTPAHFHTAPPCHSIPIATASPATAAGFLQVAVSKARISTVLACASPSARFRYSTKTYRVTMSWQGYITVRA
jgi:hypothetical protein